MSVVASLCFWCGRPDGRTGEAPERADGEPTLNVLNDYEPCVGCRAEMERGVTLYEVRRSPFHGEDQPDLLGAFPTGRWVVVDDEAIDRILADPKLAVAVKENRRVGIEPDVWVKLGLPRWETSATELL